MFLLVLVLTLLATGTGFSAAAKLDTANYGAPRYADTAGLMLLIILVFYAVLAAITYWALYCKELWVKWGCLVFTLLLVVTSIGRWTSSLFTWILIDAPGQSFPGAVRFLLALSVLGQLGVEVWFLSLLFRDTKR